MLNRLIHFMLFFIVSSVNAQETDLDLSMAFPGISEGVYNGQQLNFELTVTNLGPDIAVPPGDGFFFISSSIISSDEEWVPEIQFELDSMNSPPECHFLISFADPLPGQTPNYAFAFLFSHLEPSQSITCRGFYTVNFASGERTVDWTMINNLTPDPNLSNNSYSVVFGLRPVAVPINSWWSLLLLVFIFTLSSFHWLKRKKENL